jgi:hypothetical protein
MSKSVAVLAGLLLLAAARAEALSKCLERDGRCMAVTVNGQASVKLGKNTKQVLRQMENVSSYEVKYEVKQARYELPAPIRGELDIKADRSKDSGDWFGGSLHFEAMVVPLDDVDLSTRQHVSTAQNVQVEGGAPLVAQEVLDQKRLPPGRYLLVVTLNGDSNWDRQTLYFVVE